VPSASSAFLFVGVICSEAADAAAAGPCNCCFSAVIRGASGMLRRQQSNRAAVALRRPAAPPARPATHPRQHTSHVVENISEK